MDSKAFYRLCRGLEAAAKKKVPLQGSKELLGYLSVQHRVKPTPDDIVAALYCVGLKETDVATVTQAEVLQVLGDVLSEVANVKRDCDELRKRCDELRNTAGVHHGELKVISKKVHTLQKAMESPIPDL